MKKQRFDFDECMIMMRNRRDAHMQEEGFQMLLRHAGECLNQLIEEFNRETESGLRCWLIELIGKAKSPLALDFLSGQLRSKDDGIQFYAIWGLKNLDSKESRTLLWRARSFKFDSPAEAENFRSQLDRVLNQRW